MQPVRTFLATTVLCLVLSTLGLGVAEGQTERTTLGQQGYLVIEGVRDTTGVFAWQDGPAPGRHSLVWPEGTLSLPLDMALDEFGRLDAGVPCAAELSGVGGSGRLVFDDGIYEISEPVLLADGVLELHLSAGELEVRGSQIQYRRPPSRDDKPANTQANYIFLAGLVVLVIVLMRRARRRIGNS